jgi:hypothetical protein
MPRINVGIGNYCVNPCQPICSRLPVATASAASGCGSLGASQSQRAGANERQETAPRRQTRSRGTAPLPTRGCLVLLLRGLAMPRGRTTALTVRLTPAERQTLRAWQRSTRIPAGLARRGRILLLRADGRTITEIAAAVGLSRRHTYKWLKRFIQEGLEGLSDRPTQRRQSAPRRPALQEQRDMDARSRAQGVNR